MQLARVANKHDTICQSYPQLFLMQPLSCFNMVSGFALFVFIFMNFWHSTSVLSSILSLNVGSLPLLIIEFVMPVRPLVKVLPRSKWWFRNGRLCIAFFLVQICESDMWCSIIWSGCFLYLEVHSCSICSGVWKWYNIPGEIWRFVIGRLYRVCHYLRRLCVLLR